VFSFAALQVAACRSPAPSAEPKLTLAETRHDYGAALTHDALRHAFVLQNSGSAPLELADPELGHDCVASLSAKRVPPNASATLTVICRPNQYGPFSSTVTLHSNDARAERVLLELAAQVSPRLAFRDPMLAIEVPFGQTREQTLALFGAALHEARLSLLSPPEAGLEIAVVRTSEGERLRVHALGQPVGMRIGQIKVSTGLADPPQLELPFSYTVRGTLSVEPSNPFFDLAAPSGRELELHIKSSQAGFRLLAADVLDGPFRAALVRKGDESAAAAERVALTFLPELARGDQRGALGHVRLRSTDRSEPEKVVTLMAFGSAAP
jgi:hypothetical protein